MPAGQIQGERFRIGDLTLDVACGSLQRAGERVPLAPKSLQLLAELARQYPKVVRRIDLIEAVWADELITDQTLSQRVSLLRRELGDTAGEPTYIGRAWGCGYHLIAPVEAIADGEVPVPARTTVLVLPFDHLGAEGDPGFGEGLAEEITAGLAALGGLAVASRTTALQAKRLDRPLRDFCRELGVDFLLEGTVRWAPLPAGGLEGRFTAQLIRAADDTHLWAMHLDIPPGPILEAQASLGQRVILKVRESAAEAAVTAGGLRLAVMPFRGEGAAPGDAWLEAWLAHALGLEARDRGAALPGSHSAVANLLPVPGGDWAPEDLARAAGLLEVQWVVSGSFVRISGGLRLTPRLYDAVSGRAYAWEPLTGTWDDLGGLLARVMDRLQEAVRGPGRDTGPDRLGAFEAYARGRKRFFAKGKNALEETRRNFQQALRLDPGYAMAHSGLGSVLALGYIQRTDPACLAQAADHLHRALVLDPEITEPYPWLCYVLMRQGNLEEAVLMGRKSVLLQPDYVYAHYFHGLAHLVLAERDPGGLEEAETCFRAAVEVDATHIPAWICLSSCALQRGDYAGALETGIRATALERGGVTVSLFPGNEAFLGQVHLRLGDLDTAERCFRTAAEVMERTDHALREAMLGLCACGVGEALLRRGDPSRALPAFRKAWQLASEFPSMLGAGRLRLLAGAGLASAYAITGSRDKALGLLRAASVEEVRPETWLAGAGKAQIAYGLALAWLRCGETQAALDGLASAVACGWRDQACLAGDPDLAPLRGLPGFPGGLLNT
ncbi:winged helix-turn-helix domain-containing protein [Geothrix sp. 21YS21S-2]|uniref:winged helix-turn-helix domain-containing protein n=1 Tax=Geothrix sp. 21YS21S-2 TaxID=3068893 RepID=UPI0027BA2DFA|nr:winged helix-turn-helix domain-containing protein [Geothrix sp. 21YS21S-2]